MLKLGKHIFEVNSLRNVYIISRSVSKKSPEDFYTKKTPIEHILLRPGIEKVTIRYVCW